MTAPSWSQLRADLLRIYAAGVAAVAPALLLDRALTGALDPRLPGLLAAPARLRVLAVGKAAFGMALAVQSRCGAQIEEALVVAPAPAATPPPAGLTVVVGAHPLPADASVAAGAAALALVGRARPGERVLLLLSGGASALMAVPAPGITLGDKVALTAALMRAGASIHELNTVRKHLSAVKGGGLLRALNADATMLTLVLSDVPGNDLATIGSGPTVADPTTFADAIAVLKRRKLWGRTPEAVRDRFERGAAHEIDDTMKRDDPALRRTLSVVIGDNETAVAGALAAARAAGYTVARGADLSAPAERVCGSLASQLAASQPGERTCVIAGGEPQVTIRGAGRGGRAQHCALLLAVALAREAPERPLAALFAGTDGIDGPTDAAGAILTSATIRRAAEARLDPAAALARNDSSSFFRALGDLIIIGPTGTNVTDLFVGLVAG